MRLRAVSSLNRIELWIPLSVGTEQLMRQVSKFDCDYTISRCGDTIRFSCDSDELRERVKAHTVHAREIYIVSAQT
jgi:hypothetical protein